MVNFLDKLSNKVILLISGGLLLGMGGVVALLVLNVLDDTTFTLIMFLLLITFSTLTSLIWKRKFEKRLMDKKKGEVYELKEDINFSKPLKTLKANYGEVSLFLEDRTLFALVKVVDNESFFSSSQQQVKYNVDKKKYDNLIQFYIFETTDMNIYKKISIINYQADNFYVGSFIYSSENNTLFQTEYIKPNEKYELIYQKFLQLVNIK